MLPQLAVSAKILCLLMVVICGAVPSMVRSVRLFNQCSHQYVNIMRNGTVMACSELKDQPNLTFSTRGHSLQLLIYSPAQNMYLCFSRGSKLVGRRMTRPEAEKSDRCLFMEEFLDGYNRYRLVKYPDRYLGFNSHGVQIRRGKSRLPERKLICLTFMKQNDDFDINRHNTILAGVGGRPPWSHISKLWAEQGSIKPRHNFRHAKHGRRRPRLGNGT